MLAPGIASRAVDDGCDAVRFALGTPSARSKRGSTGRSEVLSAVSPGSPGTV